MTGPDPDIILARIASLRGRIDAAETKRAGLVAERNRLFAEARKLSPPITMVCLGEAAGISQVTVTRVLTAATTDPA